MCKCYSCASGVVSDDKTGEEVMAENVANIQQRLATRIIANIESELEELKDLFSQEGIDFHEMSNQDRQSRSEARTARRNKDGSPDRRFRENRDGPTGQGRVNSDDDQRLKENRG